MPPRLTTVIIVLLFLFAFITAIPSPERETIKIIPQPEEGYVLEGVKSVIAKDCRLSGSEIAKVNWNDIQRYHESLKDTNIISLRFKLHNRIIISTYRIDLEKNQLDFVQCPR